jgi:hypothetical protein
MGTPLESVARQFMAQFGPFVSMLFFAPRDGLTPQNVRCNATAGSVSV